MALDQFPLMIPGASSAADDSTVVAPFDESPIATVARGDEDAAETALATAYALYRDRDKWLSTARRIEILERAVEIVAERSDELAIESAREGGKPLVDSQVEAARALDSLRLCIEELRTKGGTVIPMSTSASSANRIAFTTHEPIGVVVAVSAFNHPINLIAHQVFPAVATGCPVIVKPAGDTPLSCLRLVQILREAGLPDEWCQPIVTSHNKVAEKLVTDPRVAFFSFIGSSRIGWMLRSKLAPGTRCALEHGGVAPVILAKDADLDIAVPSLAKGGFYHAGQVCVSVQRVYADKAVAQTFAERLAQAAGGLTVGDPTKSSTEVGPLIRPAEANRVGEWVDEAVAAGASVLTGGERISDTCYAPTVLLNPPADVRMSRQEVFGPAVCVYSYDDMDAAVAEANSLPVSFQAAVFTQSIDTALRAYRKIDASAVMVNDHTAFRVDWMPFAGLRESGHGVGGVPYTMHEMSVEKMMVLKSNEIQL